MAALYGPANKLWIYAQPYISALYSGTYDTHLDDWRPLNALLDTGATGFPANLDLKCRLPDTSDNSQLRYS